MSGDYDGEADPGLQDMVDDCMMCCEELTDWELQFIDSIALKLDNGQTLTASQQKKLGEVWERARKETDLWK